MDAVQRCSPIHWGTVRDIAFVITSVALLAIGIGGLAHFSFFGLGTLSRDVSLILLTGGLITTGLGIFLHMYSSSQESPPNFQQPNNPVKPAKKPEVPVNVFYGRTRDAHDHLLDDPDYDEPGLTLTVKGKDYVEVNRQMVDFYANKRIFFPGSSSRREILLLDSENSPLLHQFYSEFERETKEWGKNGCPMDFFVPSLAHFMRTKVFSKTPHGTTPDGKSRAEIAIDQIVSGHGDGKDNLSPKMSIEVFLQRQIGVCRHHSLVAGYFADRFLTENPGLFAEKAKIQLIRTKIHGGAHAWLTIICDNGKFYCLDSLNGLSGDMSDRQFRRRIDTVFGPEAREKQLRRAAIIFHRYFGHKVPAQGLPKAPNAPHIPGVHQPKLQIHFLKKP